MHLEAAKLATYHAASLYDRSFQGHPNHDPSITTHAVGVACNSAKYLAAEAAFTACERSVMSMGGMGYAAEYHVERYMRECFVPRIAPVSRVSICQVDRFIHESMQTDKQSQEMIMNFVGEKVLKLPRSY